MNAIANPVLDREDAKQLKKKPRKKQSPYGSVAKLVVKCMSPSGWYRPGHNDFVHLVFTRSQISNALANQWRAGKLERRMAGTGTSTYEYRKPQKGVTLASVPSTKAMAPVVTPDTSVEKAYTAADLLSLMENAELLREQLLAAASSISKALQILRD